MTAHGDRLNRIVEAQAARAQEREQCREAGGDYRFVTVHEGPEIESAHRAVESAQQTYDSTFTTEGPWIAQVVKNNLPWVRSKRRRAVAQKMSALHTISQGVTIIQGNQELYWDEAASGMHD